MNPAPRLSDGSVAAETADASLALRFLAEPVPERLPLPATPGEAILGWDYRVGPERSFFVQVWQDRCEVLPDDQQWAPVRVYASQLDALIAARHELTRIAAQALADVDRMIAEQRKELAQVSAERAAARDGAATPGALEQR